MDTPTTPTNGTTDEPREMPPLLTVPQTASLIGMSIRSTYRAIEADAIPTSASDGASASPPPSSSTSSACPTTP